MEHGDAVLPAAVVMIANPESSASGVKAIVVFHSCCSFRVEHGSYFKVWNIRSDRSDTRMQSRLHPWRFLTVPKDPGKLAFFYIFFNNHTTEKSPYLWSLNGHLWGLRIIVKVSLSYAVRDSLQKKQRKGWGDRKRRRGEEENAEKQS